LIKAAISAFMLLTLGACRSLPPSPTPPANRVEVAGVTQGAAGIESIDSRTRVFVDRALANLGQPYRYGGAAPGGFDCSGLISYAAAAAGIALPRTAHEQLASGVPINRDELRAGDLIFMHLSKKQLHVGLVVDEQRFIHAPSAGSQVRIDSLAALPYSMKIFAARRIIGPHAVKVQ
jgi:cell wall-associated NlpC family hydrolase